MFRIAFNRIAPVGKCWLFGLGHLGRTQKVAEEEVSSGFEPNGQFPYGISVTVVYYYEILLGFIG